MLILPIVLPLLGALALFLWRPKSRVARGALVMGTTLATTACVAWCICTPGTHAFTLLRLTDTLTISFKLDGLGRVFSGLVGFLWPLASLYALEYMTHVGKENHFFGFYLISYSVTLSIAFAEDLMTLYVFYELLTLATLPLVMHGMSARSVHAGRKYVYYSLGGAALAFLALVTVVYYSGGSNFTIGGLPGMQAAPTPLLLTMFLLGFLGFGVKAAIFPFHSWLPEASIAPTPVTALL
ncbi:MAG: proton-conducting transporter membrane subunit, partial [Clostridia bacterium]